MSNKIDQRIVEMSFENNKFEKGIKESKGSLTEFSNALKRMDTGKNFDGLDNSVRSVSSSFSILEQIGVGALRRIGEMAVNAGSSLFKSLTVDQLTAGLTKYEEKLNAVQTMVSAGYDFTSVERSMEQLMWFSDETSYSFSDMAGNMAKFIASGVDLQTSERAMQGIATWAAHSGKNSQAASIAMFNLSQAISMGYVDTLNWRSIMNQNMNTVMFKEIAIGVAEATGAIKKGQVTIQNFDSNLKDKWFTNDVLLKTLEQYSSYAEKVREVQEEMNFGTAQQAMDYMDQHSEQYADVINTIGNAAFKASQESKSFTDSINATMDAVSSGWLRTYEIIFGTLDEAKANFSQLTEILWTVFAASAEGRNSMLQWLKDAGGITKAFQSLKNIAIAVLKPLQSISKAFDQFFPPKTEQQWLGIINAFEIFTRALIVSDEIADKIRRTFAGFFAVMDIGWQTIKFLGSALFEVAKIFIPLGGGVLDATASLGDFLVHLNGLIKSSGIFQYALLGVQIVIAELRTRLQFMAVTVKDFITTLLASDKPFEMLGDIVHRVFTRIINSIKMAVDWIGGKFTGALGGVRKVVQKDLGQDTTSIFTNMLDILKTIVDFIVDKAIGGFTDFGETLKNLDFSKVATFATGGILLLFINQLTQLTKAMTDIVNTANTFVTTFSKKLFKSTTAIKDYAYVIGILTASLYVLSRIPWSDLKKGLIGVAGAVSIFVAAYAGIQTVNVIASKMMKGSDMVKTAFNLTTLAGGLAIMATAIKVIAGIDGNSIYKAVGTLGIMMTYLTAYQAMVVLIGKIPGQKAIQMQTASMGVGLLALVGAIKILSLITDAEVMSGMGKLSSILLILGAIQTSFGLASRITGGNKLSVNMLSLSAGVLGMIAVLKLLGFIDSKTITRGIGNLALIATVLAGIQVIFGLAGKLGGGVKFKTNVLSIQLGMTAMIGLIAILGLMDQTKINNGIVTLAKMGGIIAGIEILTALAARISGGAKVQKILASVSITMLAFTGLIGILGFFDQSTIDRGLITITKMFGIIAAMEVITGLIGNFTGNIQSITSMVGVIGAILTLTAAMALLSIIDQEQLRKATISLTIASVALGALAVGVAAITTALSTMSTGFAGIGNMIKMLIPGFIGLSSALLATGVLFAAINTMMPILKQIDWSNLGKFAAGLGMVAVLTIAMNSLATMNSLTVFTGGVHSLNSAFTSMAIIVLSTMGLFKAIEFISPTLDAINWNTFGKFTLGLTMIGVMTVAMAALAPIFKAVGAIQVVLPGVLVAMASLSLILAAFVGLSSAMQKLFGGNEDFLIGGIDKLVLVAQGIGRFIGAFVGGFAMETLVGIGEGLAKFSDAVSRIQVNDLSGIRNLSETILILTASALIDGLLRFISFGRKTPMETFGEQMTKLIKVFAKMNTGDADHASGVLLALGPMAKNLKALAEASQAIPRNSGLFDLFAGDKAIHRFGEQLKQFVNSLTEVSPAEATHSANVLAALEPMVGSLKAVAKAAEGIPNSGGFLGAFLGENDINTFGLMLSDFINTFVDFDVSRDIEKTVSVLKAMTPMAGVLKEFAQAAQDIPNTGGGITKFFGDNDIGTFSAALKGIVDSFGGIDNSKVVLASNNIALMGEQMIPALQSFSTLEAGLSTTGSWMHNVVSGKSTLSKFGKELAKFVKELEGVDFRIVAPAMRSLAEINTSFESVGTTALENAKKSFENNAQPFQASVTSLLDEAIKTIQTKRTIMVTDITNILRDAIKDSKPYTKEFQQLGKDLILGLKKGIESERGSAVSAISDVSKRVVGRAKEVFQTASPSRIFATIGGWCTKGLANGITKETKTAVDASTTMARSVENSVRNTLGVHSESKTFKNIGTWLPKSIDSGIQNGKQGLLNTAKDLGIDTSKFTVNGITSGISSQEGAITTGITSLLEILTDTTAVSTASTNAGASMGGGITSGLQSALSDKKKGLGGSKTQEIVKTELEKLQAVLEEGKYYGQLSLEEELEAYEALRLVKGQSAEDHKKIDREVFRLVKEIYEAQISYITEVTETEEDAMAEREKLYSEYLKNTSDARNEAAKKLADLETKYEDDVQSARESARKKEQDADKKYREDMNRLLDNAENERIKIRENYASKQKSINDKLISDIDAQNKAYENAVKSRADAIYSSYGLFSKVDEDSEVTGDELLQNLRDQGEALSEWQQSLDALKARGISTALLEELQQLGPASKAQLKALMSLTNEQLDEYVRLFEGKYVFARVKAEDELVGLKDSTSQIIKDLNKQAGADLRELEYEFRDSMSAVSSQLSLDMRALKGTYEESMREIRDELSTKLNDLKSAFDKSSKEINDDLQTKLADMEKNYQTSLEKINKDTDAKLKDLKSKFGSTMKEIDSMTETEFKELIAENKSKLELLNTNTRALLTITEGIYDQAGNRINTNFASDMNSLQVQSGQSITGLNRSASQQLSSLSQSFSNAGWNSAAGFAGGIRDGSYMAVSAASYMAQQAVDAARRTLSERSPSRVFKEIGQFASIGFAGGITDYAWKAMDAATKMADGPIAAVSRAMAEIGSTIDSEVDWEPVIRPVLDLSNLGLTSLASRISLGNNSSRLATETIQNGTDTPTQEPSIVNQFDMTGMVVRSESDIDSIATKLYQKQARDLRGRGVRSRIVPT